MNLKNKNRHIKLGFFLILISFFFFNCTTTTSYTFNEKLEEITNAIENVAKKIKSTTTIKQNEISVNKFVLKSKITVEKIFTNKLILNITSLHKKRSDLLNSFIRQELNYKVLNEKKLKKKNLLLFNIIGIFSSMGAAAYLNFDNPTEQKADYIIYLVGIPLEYLEYYLYGSIENNGKFSITNKWLWIAYGALRIMMIFENIYIIQHNDILGAGYKFEF